MWETCVWSLGWEDPLEKGKATHPILWPGEFHGLHSRCSRKELHMTAISSSLHFKLFSSICNSWSRPSSLSFLNFCMGHSLSLEWLPSYMLIQLIPLHPDHLWGFPWVPLPWAYLGTSVPSHWFAQSCILACLLSTKRLINSHHPLGKVLILEPWDYRLAGEVGAHFLLLFTAWSISWLWGHLVVVVQSLSCVQLFAPHGLQHTRLPCPSPSPRVCPCSCPLSRWCCPTISSSVVLFSFCWRGNGKPLQYSCHENPMNSIKRPSG